MILKLNGPEEKERTNSVTTPSAKADGFPHALTTASVATHAATRYVNATRPRPGLRMIQVEKTQRLLNKLYAARDLVRQLPEFIQLPRIVFQDVSWIAPALSALR